MSQKLKFKNQNKISTFKWLECILLTIVVSAVAAPFVQSFWYHLLSSPNLAVSSEAKSMVTSMNHGQQAYYLEKGVFANSLQNLDIGIKEQTTNYTYSIKATPNSIFNYAIPRQAYLHRSLFEKKPVFGYVGGVFIVPVTKGSKDERMTIAILCQSKLPTTVPPMKPTYQNGILACGEGTIKMR